MLLNALGAEEFRKSTADPILSSPTTASYTDFQSAATRLFSVKGSEIRALRNLLCHRQRSDETVSSFLAELRALVKHTSLARFTFEENNAEDYVIGALLALGAKSSAIQQRLLREDNITLQNFYNIAVTVETAEADQQLLQEGKVGAIKKRSRQPSSNQVRHSSTGSRPRGRSLSRGRPPSSVCLHCGRPGRHPDNSQCPALKSRCNNCGRPGHFARICPSSKVTEPLNNQIATVRFSDTVSAPPDMCIYVRVATHSYTDASPPPRWDFDLCFVLPSGQVVRIPTTLDTGADVSLVSISIYISLLSSFPLFTPHNRLANFDGTPIKGMHSAFRAPIRHEDRAAHLTVCGTKPHDLHHWH